MVTGSHNPPQYTGLKMVLKGETLAEGDIQALRRRIETNDYTHGSGSLRQQDIVSDYIHTITGDIRVARPLKVVVDCGDRVALIDGKGGIIWPDRQMMLYAKDVLARNPGARILFDVKCSRHLAKFITKHGGQPMMWKTGHSLIKRKMKETGALLAGEMSGHIFFKERWFGFDDGLYTAARLLEIVASDARPVGDIFAELPDALSTPELRVDLPVLHQFTFMQRLLELAQFM